MYAIKLTNIFQNAYNNQQNDGLLNEQQVDNQEWSDPAKIKTFKTLAAAQKVAAALYFNDAPDLDVVELTD